MSHRTIYSGIALLCLACVGGCSTSNLMNVLPGESRSVLLQDLNPDLAPYQGSERYNLVSDEYEYIVVGDPEFDSFFYESARIAANMAQIRGVSQQVKEGTMVAETSEDVDFLTLMTAHSLRSLPTIVTDAQLLLDRSTSLEPQSLSTLQVPRAVNGLNGAQENLRQIIDSGSEVDDIIDDYQALQEDLDMVESG